MATATPTKPAAKTAALKKTPTTASTAVAVRKPAATSLVSVKEQMAAQLAALGDRIAPATGSMIRATQDKKIVLPDGTKTDGEIQVVILDFVAAHNFYRDGFDKDNIVPPDCFAIGTNPKQMFPSGNVPDKQHDNCQECPLNAWESGPKGKGKACNNERLMAVLPVGAGPDVPIWLLKASKTAIKGFDSYVADVARTFRSMPVGVVTTVGLNPSSDYPSFVFSDPVPNELLTEHFGRQAEAREMLTAARDVSGWKPVAAPVGRGGKTAARR